MDSAIHFFDSFIPFIVTVVLIVLCFVFVVKPLLNYFVVNREIEVQKKIAREYREAKETAIAARNEDENRDYK